MSLFVQPTVAPEPQNKIGSYVAAGYAAVLVSGSLAQLYTLDGFAMIIGEYQLGLSDEALHLLTALIIVTQVFALPFLLRMQLSPAFRILSLLCAVGVATLWLLISVALTVTGQQVSVPYAGDLVSIPPGVVPIVVGLILVVCAAISVYSLWPFRGGMRKTA